MLDLNENYRAFQFVGEGGVEEKTEVCPFEQRFSELAPMLKRIAKQFSRWQVMLDEDDLFQEMAIFLWQKMEANEFEGKSNTYVAKGCEFHIRNCLRMHKEKVTLESIEKPISEAGETLSDSLCAASCGSEKERLDNQLTIDEILCNGYATAVKTVFSLLSKGYTTREVGAKMGFSHVRVVKLKQELIERYQRKAAFEKI